MQIHSNSKTTIFVRAEFRKSDCSNRQLASRYGVSPATVSKWKNRSDVGDRSSRPKKVRCSLERECQELALVLRKRGLTLDECLEALKQVYPQTARATLHRFYQKNELGNLRSKRKEPHKRFKQYKPGFLHIDTFNMPKIAGRKRYCFLAVDRATRLTLLGVYNRKNKACARDFLERVLEFFPFKVLRILTDNGSEYTNHYYKGGKAKTTHPFDQVCLDNGIKHRLTKVRTPRTNGMAERMVQMAKEKALRPFRYVSHEHMERGLLEWNNTYNCIRKHGSLQRRTPLQEAIRWYKEEPDLFTKDPGSLLQVSTTC